MKRSLIAILLVLGLAGTGWAQTPSANRALFRDVSAQITNYPHFSIYDTVSAQVDNGKVTLHGKVTMPFKATEIERLVSKVAGVTSVENTITVLPVSFVDQDLRWQIARAIYTHPVLSRYGFGTVPSIHVIVENGRVSLEGVVNNDMDRQLAGTVARSSMAFAVQNNLKTNDEVRMEIAKL